MTVKEAVQETLFRQFLSGANPTCRLGDPEISDSNEGKNLPPRVEDLDWWTYDRSLAYWYCEWLDVFYDDSERVFLRHDELTRTFELVDLNELRELASRMRLELPDSSGHPATHAHSEGTSVNHAQPADGSITLQDGLAGGDNEVVDLTTCPHTSMEAVHAVVEADLDICPTVSDAERSVTVEIADGDTQRQSTLDGPWQQEAGSGVEHDVEPTWTPDGKGNLTHWNETCGRLFVWQETTEILYEYLPADRAASGAGTSQPRHSALWASHGPVCMLSLVDDPQMSRLVDWSGVQLGRGLQDNGSWAVLGFGAPCVHAKVFPSSLGEWWVESLSTDATLVDGQHVETGRVGSLQHGSILRLGHNCELRIDVPDWHGAPASVRSSEQSSSVAKQPLPMVLESSFVPAQLERPPVRSLTGNDRARELNRALRRAVCHPTIKERQVAREREERYVDQAEKRRKLRPEPSAVDCLLLREAARLEAEERHAITTGQAAELSDSAQLYRKDVAGSMDEAGVFVGSGGGRVMAEGTERRVGLGYVPPANTAAQRRFASATQAAHNEERAGLCFRKAEEQHELSGR